MADTVSVPATSPTTAVVGTDEVTIGGTLQHVQRIKLVDGTDGGTELIGGTAANGLEVDVTRVQGTVIIQGLQSSVTSGTITTTTSTITNTGASGYNLTTVAIWGTYNSVTAVFEGSPDGTNWFAIQGQRTDTGIVETGPTLITNTTRAWDVFIGAWVQVRVRATAWTSGTANVALIMQSMPSEPVPSAMLQPAIGGGCSVSRFLTAATTNTGTAKTSPGQLYGVIAVNVSASVRYLKIYDKASAPTLASDVPIMTLPVPGNTSGAGVSFPFTQGIQFVNGIARAVTGAIGDTDTTATVANDGAYNIIYK